MQNKTALIIISIYKLTMNFLRITLGIFLLFFGCNTNEMIKSIFHEEIIGDSTDLFLNFLTDHVRQTSFSLTYFFSWTLIILSSIEIFFIMIFAARKRWGAIGFFITAILWVPVEFLFVSKFLIAPKIIRLTINFIILVFLFRLLTNPHGYFRR